MKFNKSGTSVEVRFYNNTENLGNVELGTKLPYEDTVELLDELVIGGYEHVLLYLLTVGIFIDPTDINKIVLVIRRKNLCKLWVVVKEGD